MTTYDTQDTGKHLLTPKEVYSLGFRPKDSVSLPIWVKVIYNILMKDLSHVVKGLGGRPKDIGV